MELLGDGGGVLILIVAGILVFRTFRERYLLAWIVGWIAYLGYRLIGSEPALTRSMSLTAISYVAFVLSVALFAAALLYYTHARRHLLVLGILAVLSMILAVAYTVWPQSRVLAISVHAGYFAMTASAAIRLALFSRGRREPGPWLACVMLVLLHLDVSPTAPHSAAGLDFVVELLLGISMLMIVLDDTKARGQRLEAVNAITGNIAQGQDSGTLQALQRLKLLLGARAAWYCERRDNSLVIAQQIGLSERFLERKRVIAADSSDVARSVIRGVPGLFRTATLEAPLRDDLIGEGFEHIVLNPVRGHNGIIGVLGLGGSGHRSYTPEESNFLQATADQLGISLENRQLVDQVFRSQRQWVNTFDSIDDLILVHDSAFRIMKVNRALIRRLQGRFAEVVGKTCSEVLPLAQSWSGCPYCGRSGGTLAEASDAAFGGYTVVSTSSYSEEGSGRLGTIHVVKDITERRTAEENYRLLFQEVKEGVFISTPEGRVLDCNEAFVHMLGYSSREEVLALDITRDIYAYPDQRMTFRQEIAAQNYVRDFEVAVRRKDGSIITAMENSFVTRDPAGRVVRYQGFLLDITEKKRAVEEMRRRNRELHALNAIAVIATQSFDLDEILNVTLRHVMDLFAADTGSVYLLDRDGLTMRRRAAYGHRTEVGTGAAEIKLEPQFWDSIKRKHIYTLTDQRTSDLPEPVEAFVRAEQLLSWVWTIMWSKDKPIGTLGISSRSAREFSRMDEDLMVAIARQLATTIEKVHLYEETCRAYDDLRRTQEQLLQSEKMSAVGQLISGVAHELNNPLTAILGYAQLLEGEPLDDRCRDYVQKLFKQAQRTQRVVQNLLSFARQRKPQKGQVDLRRVLEDMLALRDYDLKLNNIAVEREVQPNLPTVTADAHQLEQVFLNIINNAVDAILEKGRTGLVKVRIYTQDGHVCTEFQDSGPGIKEPSRVFDPFYTTKDVGKGTGLGLSICYGIIKEHGGDVLAMNAADGGALFRVLLPATGVALAPQPEAAPRRRETVLHGRILVVDDEEAVLEFERELLVGAGAEVVAVGRGDEAIARLKQEPFDAIIVDTKMPGASSGVDLYHWIMDNRPSMKDRVIFTASNVRDPDTRAFLEQTGVPCIVKPFEVADLIAMTRRISQKTRTAEASGAAQV